jgi:hypothetical protein
MITARARIVTVDEGLADGVVVRGKGEVAVAQAARAHGAADLGHDIVHGDLHAREQVDDEPVQQQQRHCHYDVDDDSDRLADSAREAAASRAVRRHRRRHPQPRGGKSAATAGAARSVLAAGACVVERLNICAQQV